MPGLKGLQAVCLSNCQQVCRPLNLFPCPALIALLPGVRQLVVPGRSHLLHPLPVSFRPGRELLRYTGGLRAEEAAARYQSQGGAHQQFHGGTKFFFFFMFSTRDGCC